MVGWGGQKASSYRSQRPQLLLTTRWPRQVAPVPTVPEPAVTWAGPTLPAQPDSCPPLPSLGSFQVPDLFLPAWSPIVWLLHGWFGPECCTGLVYTSLRLHRSARGSARINLLGYNLLNTRASQQYPATPLNTDSKGQEQDLYLLRPQGLLVTLALGPHSHYHWPHLSKAPPSGSLQY